MQTTTLGRTGLTVSVAGLGCGGFSKIGIRKGIDHAASVTRAAYDSGVTFFDTAAAYGTEEAVAKGLEGLPRESYVLSTKFLVRFDNGLMKPEETLETLENSLSRLKTDYIDIFHIHALTAPDYQWAIKEILPLMLKAKEQGKIRFAGVTEQFIVDPSHKMLKLALPDDLFDVVMAGYSIINPSAAQTLLPTAIKNNVGVLDMFAVRTSLHNPAQLANDIAFINSKGQGGEGLNAHSLDFLVEEGIASTLPEAAYRFCRHTPGIGVTLTGTGDLDHLAENLRSINLPPLPDEALKRLDSLFHNVDCVCGQNVNVSI
ncbi:MAG: aldo/keto reductase [Clostridiales bacterium]|nr:aldo/keto reductase [Clostridiales bacterium]